MNRYCLGLLLIILISMVIRTKEGITNSAQPGTCGSNETQDKSNYHTCNFNEPEDKNIDMRYVDSAPLALSNSTEFLYNKICPDSYVSNLQSILQSKQKRQYAGYSENKYIDRIKYMEPSEPLPVNPDFFMPWGGTYA